MTTENFESFKKERYQSIPWDFTWNIRGFQECNPTKHHSDISAHLPFLEFLAKHCNHVTEFGTRNCYSTCAFINGAKERVVSYDIQITGPIQELQELNLPCWWDFYKRNTIDDTLEIEETDFLFIDTWHTYEQVKKELQLHSHKVRKWIGFHDTYSQGAVSLDEPGKIGIKPAIEEFLAKHTKTWKVVYEVDFNHGLLIIERF